MKGNQAATGTFACDGGVTFVQGAQPSTQGLGEGRPDTSDEPCWPTHRSPHTVYKNKFKTKMGKS